MAKPNKSASGGNPINGKGINSITAGPGIGATTLPPNLVFPTTISPIIASPTPVMTQLRAIWQQVDALWGGTMAMRNAGETFLPKEEKEEPDDYQRRLKRSTLYSAYKKTIQSGSARVFSTDVALVPATEDTDEKQPDSSLVTPQMKLFACDVDAQGRNLSQFAKGLFEDGVNHGVGFLLVDYSRLPEEYPTLADELQSGDRPYWIEIPATNVLDCRTDNFNGQQRMSMFRYEEVVNELASDNLTPVSYQQVRIYKQDPGGAVMFAVYRHMQQVGQTNWTLMDYGVLNGVDSIPVVPFYTNRIGFGQGKPPLQDLADLNIQHWQAYSDFANINHIVNVPFLFTKGIKAEMDENGNEKEITVSVRAGVTTANTEADIKWIEHTGASLQAASKHIEDIEDRMDRLGLQLTARITPGGKTATEASLNSAEANSILKSMALNLQDTLNAALYFTAGYLGLPDNTRAKVETRYATEFAPDSNFTDVIKAFQLGAIDKETVIYEGKRRNIFDPLADIVPPETNQASAVSASEQVTQQTNQPQSPVDTDQDDDGDE